MRAWYYRWRCHRSIRCCQYTDNPNCNGSLEPHRLLWLPRRSTHRSRYRMVNGKHREDFRPKRAYRYQGSR